MDFRLCLLKVTVLEIRLTFILFFIINYSPFRGGGGGIGGAGARKKRNAPSGHGVTARRRFRVARRERRRSRPWRETKGRHVTTAGGAMVGMTGRRGTATHAAAST